MDFPISVTSKTGNVFVVTGVKAMDEVHGTNTEFHEKRIFSTLSTLPGAKFSINTRKMLDQKSIYRLRDTGNQEITYEDDKGVPFVIVVVCDNSGEGDFLSSVPKLVYVMCDV